MKIKWKLVFNKRICRSLFQVFNFYLTSTVRNVTQNKKKNFFHIAFFFHSSHLIRLKKKQQIELYHFRKLLLFKQMPVHGHVK